MNKRTVEVKLSETIRNEYATRCVFNGGEWPEVPDAPIVTVPIETALSMLDDAEYNGSIGKHAGQGPDCMPLSIGNAYRALAKQIAKKVAA